MQRSARLVALAASSALALPLVLATACGGSLSVLHAQGKATTGDGTARVDVLNSSGVAIEKLHVAKTETVDHARAAGVTPGSAEDEALWGDDRFGNAGLLEGHTFGSLMLPDGRYDVLVVDHDQREQLVKHLTVKGGRRYVLEIGTAWTMAR